VCAGLIVVTMGVAIRKQLQHARVPFENGESVSPSSK
jgi:hypothetical protein